jgi:hypothetical protein
MPNRAGDCKPSERSRPTVNYPGRPHPTKSNGLRTPSPGRHQRLVQRVAEAARLIHRVDGVPSRGLFPHPLHQLGPRELLRGLERAVIALDRGHHELQVHVQAEFEDVAHARRRLVSGAGCGCSERVMRDCGVVHTTRRVPVLPTPRNPSWHLTRPSRRGLQS